MSTARVTLTFLYPQLYRGVRAGDTAASAAAAAKSFQRTSRPALPPRRCQHAATFSTSAAARQTVLSRKRHGKAVEPLPEHDESKKAAPPPASSEGSPSTPKDAAKDTSTEPGTPETKAKPSEEGQKNAEPSQQSAQDQKQDQIKTEQKSAATQPTQEATVAKPAVESQSPNPSPVQEGDATAQATAAGASGSVPAAETSKEDKKREGRANGPMETVLHMGPPEEAKHKPPHLVAPPYVHHFDSYSLVKQLEGGGYSRDHAVTAMKAVRGILAQNLDVAQDGLVSKSDIENETYLFRAACSELSTEVHNNRRVADEQMRQQRTTLHHEVDILTQTLNQELLKLNDDVRGMFNDRKMAVREEQKAAESSIQQINYKISIMLNSDAKSDIEGLRWVLIRRAVTGIIFLGVFTFGTLRYATYLGHERQREAERLAKEAELMRKHDGRFDNSTAPQVAEILAAN